MIGEYLVIPPNETISAVLRALSAAIVQRCSCRFIGIFNFLIPMYKYRVVVEREPEDAGFRGLNGTG